MFLQILLPYSALWLQKIHLAGCNETIKHRLFTDFVKTELTSSYERIKNNFNSKSTKHHTYSHTTYCIFSMASLSALSNNSIKNNSVILLFDNESTLISPYHESLTAMCSPFSSLCTILFPLL